MPIIDKRKLKHNAVIHEGICLSCGITFYANRPQAIYCSDLCRCHAYLKRKKEKQTSAISKDVKSEKIYFKSKHELARHVRQLGYTADLYNFVWHKGERSSIRIALQKYIIERISHKEYTIEDGGVV